MIGTVGDQGMFYTAPDGNGMYFVWGKQGCQRITRVTKSGNAITETEIESRQLMKYIQALQNPIQVSEY